MQQVSTDHDCGNLSALDERTQIELLEENPINLEIDESNVVTGIAPARYTAIK